MALVIIDGNNVGTVHRKDGTDLQHQNELTQTEISVLEQAEKVLQEHNLGNISNEISGAI